MDRRRDRNIDTPARKSLMMLALFALAGCSGGPKPGEVALACPKVGIVRELQEITQFRPGGHQDLSDMSTRAALAEYSGNCDYDRDGVTMSLNLFVVAERGPALQGDTATYRYFVAVARPGEEIPATKTEFDTTVTFPKGQNRVLYKEELAPKIPLPKDANAKDWQVMVGFQLTPEQLDFNMKAIKQAKK